MAEPLAPCPYCGGHVIDLFEGSVGGGYAAAMCRTCHATGPEGATRAEAEQLWNMRVAPQSTP
jgi:Lar family restriction alleviation protein